MKGEYGTYKVVRNRKGQFKNRGFVKGIVLAVTVLVIGAIVYTGEVWVPAQNLWGKMKNQELKAVNTFVPKAEADEIKPDALEKMKYDVLKDLQMCESGGREGEEAMGLVTFDPDKSKIGSQTGSFGSFQFKVGTMQVYWEKKTGEKLSILAAQNKARDWDTAWSVAEYVIFELDKKPSSDWYHCSVKGDLDNRAKFINKYDI